MHQVPIASLLTPSVQYSWSHWDTSSKPKMHWQNTFTRIWIFDYILLTALANIVLLNMMHCDQILLTKKTQSWRTLFAQYSKNKTTLTCVACVYSYTSCRLEVISRPQFLSQGAMKAHTEQREWTELNWHDLVFDDVTNERARRSWLQSRITDAVIGWCLI